MYYYRYLEEALLGPVSRNKIRILFGARQTGKTALLQHLVRGVRSHFVNLQEAGERRRFEADPAAFAREIKALERSVRAVVVDEVQKVPALLDEVQALYDAAPKRWQFFLTGSSARRLRTRSANLLPGRSHSYRLGPVCGWEEDRGQAGQEIAAPRRRMRGGRQLSASSLGLAAPPFPRQSLDRVLRFGALPGVRAESAASAVQTLDTYVGHYLEEEIRREALVREMGPFLVFLRLAAVEAGRQVNLARLSQESGVAASTLKTYYQVLVDTFVGDWMLPYSRRARKRLLKTPRFYFFDVGVRNAAAEILPQGRLAGDEAGRLLEAWVAQELLARAAYLGRGHRVTFWRTTYGAEVDFVWETPKEDLPIEVKWASRPRPTDVRRIEAFLDGDPERSRRGLLVCRTPRRMQLTDRVLAVPWHDL